jgi:cation diffusion facilitator CzcD-associated flavoprotein CzcO
MGEEALLVVGAGPLGLAVAKALREAGIPYEQAERTDHVGGNWAHGVYETAHIISSRRTTEFPDWPMPADWPDFPSAEQMRAYLEGFADAHGLRDAIRFGAEVASVAYQPDRSWLVTFGDGAVRRYKGVVVCNGHHWDRDWPAWADPARFSGRLLHSKDYRRPDELAGRRVVVVGGGNSGCDVVAEAARVASHATWSLRRGYWFLPKTMFGVPTVELMSPLLPVAAQRLVMRGLLRVTVGPYAAYGLPAPDHRLFEAHPSVSTEALHYLKHGRIEVRPDIARLDGDRVHFTDGRSAEADVVVCATGFKVSFPFLPAGMVPVLGKTAQLYGGLLRPEYRHLYVFGTGQARYGIGPLVRPYARMLARWVKLQDAIAPNLGQVLLRVGLKPNEHHLVDPHRSLRQLWLAEHVHERILRRVAERMAA